MEKYLCKICGIQLVETDENGKLHFGRHQRWCAAKYPSNDSPGLKSAKSKLVCGGGNGCKRHSNSQISDLGEIAICKGCPNEALARESVDAHVKLSGGKKPVEVVYPARRRKFSVVPVTLYLDALDRIVKLERKLEQYENRQ